MKPLIPPDPDLQSMAYEDLQGLFRLRPGHSTNQEWVRVAKELRSRDNVRKAITDNDLRRISPRYFTQAEIEARGSRWIS